MFMVNGKNMNTEQKVKTEVKAIMALAAAGLIGGCSVYSDGRVASAFDQGAIKAELMKAEREYGGR